MVKWVPMLLIYGLLSANLVADDLKPLQGTWIGTESGQEDKGKVTLSVTRDAIEFQSWRQGEWYKATIQLSRTDEHHKIFTTIKDCPLKLFVGKVCNGIYTLDGKTLTIASRGPGDPDEPTGFDDVKCRTMTLNKQD